MDPQAPSTATETGRKRLAACWGWLADLVGRKPRNVVKDAAAIGLVGELLDRTLDDVDGC